MLRAVATPSYSAILNTPTQNGWRVATIGTSLVQQSHEGSSTPRISSSARGWMPWARFYSNGAIYHPVWWDSTVITGWEPSGVGGSTRYFQGLNFGVSGQTAAQIVARLPYIDANYINKFDEIVVDAGTNDMSSDTIANIHANRVIICEFFLSRGKRVTLLPILSRSTSVWASGSDERKKANALNNLSRQYVRTKKNLKFFDWNMAWTDGSTADGTPYASYTIDGTHFNVSGAESVGYAFWQFISNDIPPASYRVWSQDDAYDATLNVWGNLFLNPFCGGTSGTATAPATGSVATNWRVERTTGTVCSVVCTKEARANGRGGWQVMTFTIAGTTEEIFFFRPTASSDITHSLGGKWVIASCVVETNATDGLTGLNLRVVDQNGTSGQTTTSMYYYDAGLGAGNEKWRTAARAGMLITEPMFLAADSTTVRPRLEIRVKGASAVNPIIKVSEMELRQIDDPRIG